VIIHKIQTPLAFMSMVNPGSTDGETIDGFRYPLIPNCQALEAYATEIPILATSENCSTADIVAGPLRNWQRYASDDATQFLQTQTRTRDPSERLCILAQRRSRLKGGDWSRSLERACWSKIRRQAPGIITTWRLRSRRAQTPFKGLMTRTRENGEHVAQLWSRGRNQKGMDYATGRAIIVKFDLGDL
jgi:hypothetical protein